MSYDSPTNDNFEPEVCKCRHEILKDISDQWVMNLDHKDKKSLAIFLCHYLMTVFPLQKHMLLNAQQRCSTSLIKKYVSGVRNWLATI